MNKLLRIIVGIACIFMLVSITASCITISAPSITAEEKMLVEKILARRAGHEITKRYYGMALELQTLSNEAIKILEGTSTDCEINNAISSFVEKLTGEYLSNDPLLQRDVLDLAEVLMPTVSIDMPEETMMLDENLKAEIINIFKSFNEGVDIAIMEDSK